MPKPLPPPDAVRRTPPPGFRPEDMVVNALPDTRETIEQSFNPQARLALDELLRLRQRRPAGR